MQAFHASATVSTQGELHIGRVPFQPGSEVEVIVLKPESRRISPSDGGPLSGMEPREPPGAAPEDRRPATPDLVRKQYQLARQYPEDYVVLVADRIVCHSPDRQEAFRAYDRAFVDFPGGDPVIVEPGGTQKRPPVFRVRSWPKKTGGGR